jgi:hypothetical protein
LFTFVKKLNVGELLEVALKPPNTANGLLAASLCRKDKKWFKIQFAATNVMVRTVVVVYLAIQELAKFSLVTSGLTNFDTAAKYCHL